MRLAGILQLRRGLVEIFLGLSTGFERRAQACFGGRHDVGDLSEAEVI